jgi:hypothetical protein
MTEENNMLLCQVARKSFEEATAASLGSTFHVIISFHLKKKFGKDPYEVLILSPGRFYEGLEEVLDRGAEAIIRLEGTYLAAKYKIDCTADEFAAIFTKNDPKSTQKLTEIFKTLIAQEENKLKID